MSVDKSETRVRRMFGEIAERYDFLNHFLSLGIDRYWRSQTVKRVMPIGKQPLLDICAGTGDLALAYFKRTKGTVPIVAADFCSEMLAIGRRKAVQAGANGELSFVEADAQRLPFADDSFQIVSVAFGLRNVSDTDQGLKEMTRVCQPGGRVAVLEFSSPQRQPLRALYNWYFRHVLPRIGQAVSRSRLGAYDYLPTSVGEFPSGEALADRMRAAGLHGVTIAPLTFGIATLYVGTKP
jgi:demethylmenaquinone methyltransferase/2-methoxy-6-polyprenyl-1,4-benzoquinol methylase